MLQVMSESFDPRFAINVRRAKIPSSQKQPLLFIRSLSHLAQILNHQFGSFLPAWVTLQAQISDHAASQRDKVVHLCMNYTVVVMPTQHDNKSSKQV